MTAYGTRHWPTDIHLDRADRSLTVAFDDGQRYTLSAEFLRVHSPSAEVRGHSPEERKTVPGKKDVGILEVEPVGNYAIRIKFDDLHETGIYSWETLRDMGENHDALWDEYLHELEQQGMRREP